MAASPPAQVQQGRAWVWRGRTVHIANHWHAHMPAAPTRHLPAANSRAQHNTPARPAALLLAASWQHTPSPPAPVLLTEQRTCASKAAGRPRLLRCDQQRAPQRQPAPRPHAAAGPVARRQREQGGEDEGGLNEEAGPGGAGHLEAQRLQQGGDSGGGKLMWCGRSCGGSQSHQHARPRPPASTDKAPKCGLRMSFPPCSRGKSRAPGHETGT